jgi:hypothetical protein
MWIVHMDTEREIPEDLFDQSKVKDRLDSSRVPYLQAFDQAIAKIDSRPTWPATAEEVAKAYLEAGAQSRWDEVAVLCPGSGAKDRKNWHGPQGEWVLEQPQKTPTPAGDQFTIRCAPKDQFEKNGKYTYAVYIRNDSSKKHRYYVNAGPY